MTELNDQILLNRYLRGADDAFRQLLERHSGLVYGTALRVTGDAGAAEDVSQDVFLLLAKKARSLGSHPSVAGWLHRTSHNVARHEQRRRARQARKVAHIADELVEQVRPESAHALVGVDEAVARLPTADREAILLRFFEDLEYGEIAARLGLSEPACRKRVSRALKRLQNSLDPHQSSAATSGALVIAAPTGIIDKLVPNLPSLGTTATSTTTILTTMTTTTALKTTAAAVIGGLLLFGNLRSHQKNKALQEDLEGAQAELNALRGNSRGAGPERTSGANTQREASTALSLANLSSQVATLNENLESERKRRAAAEKEVASLHEKLAPLEDEIVLAFGKIEEIGHDFGFLFREAHFLSQMEKDGRLEEEEIKRRLVKFYQAAASMGGLSQQIIEMEGNPEEGAKFFSATYAELFTLDEAGRSVLSDIFERHITIANEREISLQQITDLVDQEIAGGFEQEMERRMSVRQEYFREVRNELREAIPEDRRADFDLWVERDGIGFNNIRLRETTLQFSLGGNQKKEDPDAPAPVPVPAAESSPSGEGIPE